MALIVTHGHGDHVGGVSTVIRDRGARLPVHVHDADRPFLLQLQAGGAPRQGG